MINKEEIKKIAFLARLELNDVEVEKYQTQLSAILGYIDMLQELDSSDLDVLGLSADEFNQTRADEVDKWKDADKLLDQAPNTQEGQIKVNRVL